MTLPRPVGEELTTNKANYFNRIYHNDFDKKYGISHYELADWIHLNHTSVIQSGKDLNFKEFKKIKK